MLVKLPPAVAIIGAIEFMEVRVDKFCVIFCDELALGLY